VQTKTLDKLFVCFGYIPMQPQHRSNRPTIPSQTALQTKRK